MTIGNMHKIWKNLFPHHLCPSDPHSCNPSLNLTPKLQLHTLLLHLNLTNTSHFTCLKRNSSSLLCHLNSDHFLPRLQLPPQSRDLSSHLELQRTSLTLSPTFHEMLRNSISPQPTRDSHGRVNQVTERYTSFKGGRRCLKGVRWGGVWGNSHLLLF